MNDRYTRQERLKEIGAEGQARLGVAAVSIPECEASEYASVYLKRSGIGSVILERIDAALDFPHAGHFQFEICRSFAQGAWLATRRIVEILEL